MTQPDEPNTDNRTHKLELMALSLCQPKTGETEEDKANRAKYLLHELQLHFLLREEAVPLVLGHVQSTPADLRPSQGTLFRLFRHLAELDDIPLDDWAGCSLCLVTSEVPLSHEHLGHHFASLRRVLGSEGCNVLVLENLYDRRESKWKDWRRLFPGVYLACSAWAWEAFSVAVTCCLNESESRWEANHGK